MSYISSIKETENILALVEAIDQDRKKTLKEAVEDIDNTVKDEFSVDDLDNTVDLDAPNEHPGVSFDEDSIELSDEDKEIVRKNLQNMLDELSGDNISEPALEMIIMEVAQQSAYLSEAEEDSVETPVEKNELLKAKIGAIVKYAKGLLDTAEENEGEIPAEGEEEKESSETEESEEKEIPEEEGGEKEEEEESLKESTEDGVESTESEEEAEGDDDKESVDEGVCTECGEGTVEVVPEVGDDDVIKVVDDSEVEPIDLDLEVSPEEGEEKEEVDRLDSIEALLRELIGTVKKDHAVLESAGLFSDFTNKNVEGKSPVVSGSGLQKPDFQKKATTDLKVGDIKLAELRELAGKPRKVEPTTKFGKENKAEIERTKPTFAKGKNDTGKSEKEPEGAWEGKAEASAPKKPNGQREVTDPVKARVVSESVDKKTKSFLQEARRIIREGK